jgi:histidyl-tRNA synthetase
MTEEKGLDPASADKIGEYVKHKGAYPFVWFVCRLVDRKAGGRPLLDQLLADTTLTANAKAKQGLDEMSILFTFLDAYKITDKVVSFQNPCLIID